MVLRGGHNPRGSGYNGRASGALYRLGGRHERSSTAAEVQTLEGVDAHGAGALGDCSAQWCGNVLRMVCGAILIVQAHGRSDTCGFGLTVKERDGDAKEGKKCWN